MKKTIKFKDGSSIKKMTEKEQLEFSRKNTKAILGDTRENTLEAWTKIIVKNYKPQ